MPKLFSIQLPQVKVKSNISLEEAISKRKSYRAYKKTSLTIEEVSQLLFAGQGILDKTGRRTVPSAGSFYPVEIYLVAGKVKKVPAGVYKYQPEDHKLIKVFSGDCRKKLAKAAFSQFWVKDAPATIVLCGNFRRTTKKYKEKGKRFVTIEIGHAAQNICLQSAALNLGTVCVGGFEDIKVSKALNLNREERPLYLIPVGRTFKNHLKKEAEILEKFYAFLEKDFFKNV